MAYKSKPTITRPANTTAYAAGDVVGGAFEFPTIGPFSGDVLITTASLRIDVAAIPSGMTSFTLHLYDVTPPSAILDNAAWDLPSGDRANYLGKIDLGSPADLGSTLRVQVDQVNTQLRLRGGYSVWAYLVTNGGFTPAGNSEVYVPTLHSVALMAER
jgi:hypothetical protein